MLFFLKIYVTAPESPRLFYLVSSRFSHRCLPWTHPQTDTFKLLRRLQDGLDEILCLIRDQRVPFTNNEAGSEVRMPIVKLRITGGFRTPAGAHRASVSFVPVSTL